MDSDIRLTHLNCPHGSIFPQLLCSAESSTFPSPPTGSAVDCPDTSELADPPSQRCIGSQYPNRPEQLSRAAIEEQQKFHPKRRPISKITGIQVRSSNLPSGKLSQKLPVFSGLDLVSLNGHIRILAKRKPLLRISPTEEVP
jgi:hypothetical protein